tara:strand:+ start:329 stop:703 length:375 start_codon:yes stop_codon:yes gene_type:complete
VKKVLDKRFGVCYNDYTEEMMKERDMNTNIESSHGIVFGTDGSIDFACTLPVTVGTKMIGDWGGYSPLSLGEVTNIDVNGMIEVNFDDLDGYSLFWPNEIRTDYATSNEIGVYIDDREFCRFLS